MQTCNLWEVIHKHIFTLCKNWLTLLNSKQISEVGWQEKRPEVCNTMLVWVNIRLQPTNKITITKRLSKSVMSSVHSTTEIRATTLNNRLIREQRSNLKITLNILESGSLELKKDMVKEHKFGQMAQSTMDGGKKIKPTVKVDLFMPMEMSMKVNGFMTKLMDLVTTPIRTEPSMKATGWKISNMVLV